MFDSTYDRRIHIQDQTHFDDFVHFTTQQHPLADRTVFGHGKEIHLTGRRVFAPDHL